MSRYISRARLTGIAVAAGLASLAPASADATQATAPFIVNSYQPGAQWFEGVATGYNGDTATIWSDAARSGYHYLRRFDGTGGAIDGADWYAGTGRFAQVAVDGIGDFAIIRATDGSATLNDNVTLTVYNRSGVAVTSPIRVNATANGVFGTTMRVAMNRSGEIVVAWMEAITGGTGIVKARVYTRAGAALTGELNISPGGARVFSLGQVAVADDGAFAAVFVEPDYVNNRGIVVFEKFSKDGVPFTNPQQASTSTTADQNWPTLAMNGQGSAVVAWGFGEPTNRYYIGVHAQRFGISGNKSGAEFAVVNQTSVGPNAAVSSVSAGMTESGTFSLAFNTWDDVTNPGLTPKLQLREYDGAAMAAGGPFVFPAPSGFGWYGLTQMTSSPAGILTLADGASSLTDGSNIDVGALRYTTDNQAAVTTLTSGATVANQSTVTGKWIYYRILVPNATSQLTLSTVGANGNADLYGRVGALPTINNAEVKNTAPGSTQSIVINSPPPGLFYIGVYAAAGFSGLSVTATATH